MKNLTAFVFIVLCLPVMIFSQPLISNLETIKSTEQSQAVTFSKSDILPSVLTLDQTASTFDNSIQQLFTEKPGLAFLTSGLLPGSGQMVNNNWIRGGLYAALEVAAIYMVVEYNNRGERGQRRYENYADRNWSVTQYAKWLVDYHDENGLENTALNDLRNMVEEIQPAFDTTIDWKNIDIDILRAVERQSRYVAPDNFTNNTFSHILPAYGSQQYYELISKYYQFQAGWRDYDTSIYFISGSGTYASDMFFRGAQLADEFNSDLRTSKNFGLVLIANHLLSAFDSFFTFKLKQNRVQATTSIAPAKYLQLSVNF